MDGWFANVLPDINQADPDARRYLIQNSLWWVGMTGLDGIRQDTLPYVPRDFWRDWTEALRTEYPSIKVIGEVLDGLPTLVAWYQRGRTGWDGVDTGIDTLFDYPLYYAIRGTFARQGSMRDLAAVLHQDWIYPRSEQLVTLLGSHDVRRFMHERGATLDGLRLASTFLFTTRGIPQWYAGDEIAMPGGDDPDNRRDFPGGWPGDPRDAFSPAGRTADEQVVWAHTQKLLQLRKALTPLRRGRLRHLMVDDVVYAYARVHENETAIVVLNNGGLAQELAVPLTDVTVSARTFADRLTDGTIGTVRDGMLHVTVPARGAVILTPR
jgi:glycosidase